MAVDDGSDEPGTSMEKVHVPGDTVFRVETSSMRTLNLGPGIRKSGDDLVATRVGILHYKLPATFFLQTLGESYSPAANDDVIGVIVKRKGLDPSEHYYLVDLGRNLERESGVLPVLAFRGATKRHRPNLKAGDLVYCRIKRTTPNGPVRLTCVNSQGLGFWGPLRRTGGLYRASLPFVRRCLTDGSPEHTMINQVGGKTQFESAVGVNGRIYFYTGFETSQNVIYCLFRDAEAANGNSLKIKEVTNRTLHQITTMNDDIPLEDNTQYWVTRVV